MILDGDDGNQYVNETPQCIPVNNSVSAYRFELPSCTERFTCLIAIPFSQPFSSLNRNCSWTAPSRWGVNDLPARARISSLRIDPEMPRCSVRNKPSCTWYIFSMFLYAGERLAWKRPTFTTIRFQALWALLETHSLRHYLHCLYCMRLLVYAAHFICARLPRIIAF